VITQTNNFLAHIRNLSDSGIYETLTLSNIVSYEVTDGLNFNNYNLQLELGSPHYRSKRRVETFVVMVMVEHSTGDLSYAIDTFPAMDPDSVEDFWVKKVEGRREMRNYLYEGLREKGNDDAKHFEETLINVDKITRSNLNNLNNDELLNFIDQLAAKNEGVTDNADVDSVLVKAKAVLRERYITSQLSGLKGEVLKRIAEDVAEDPVRRQVAGKLLMK